MVLPFAAGGPTDTLARIIAARMQISLGQPVIIENVSGAAGTISVGRVARAAPDGYTISVGPMNSHVLTGAIYKLSFDLLNDFEPVAHRRSGAAKGNRNSPRGIMFENLTGTHVQFGRPW